MTYCCQVLRLWTAWFPVRGRGWWAAGLSLPAATPQCTSTTPWEQWHRHRPPPAPTRTHTCTRAHTQTYRVINSIILKISDMKWSCVFKNKKSMPDDVSFIATIKKVVTKGELQVAPVKGHVRCGQVFCVTRLHSSQWQDSNWRFIAPPSWPSLWTPGNNTAQLERLAQWDLIVEHLIVLVLLLHTLLEFYLACFSKVFMPITPADNVTLMQSSTGPSSFTFQGKALRRHLQSAEIETCFCVEQTSYWNGAELCAAGVH